MHFQLNPYHTNSISNIHSDFVNYFICYYLSYLVNYLNWGWRNCWFSFVNYIQRGKWFFIPFRVSIYFYRKTDTKMLIYGDNSYTCTIHVYTLRSFREKMFQPMHLKCVEHHGAGCASGISTILSDHYFSYHCIG